MPSNEQVEPRTAPGLPAGAAHPATPPQENPTSSQVVHEWIARRVAADEQMRWAGAARRARQNAQQEES